MTNPYKNGKIYKLVCQQTGDIYIGSTIRDLGERLIQHKSITNTCKSKYFVNPKIILLKNVECNSKKELEQMERFYIENNECVNKVIPGRTQKEYYEDNKEKIKKYYSHNKEQISLKGKEYYENNKEQILLDRKERYEKNKEQISLKGKEYYENNKEQISLKGKEYYEKNREKILLKDKEYYEKNKEQISLKAKEKITCDCGDIVSKCNLSRHKKTKKHINSMV